MKLYFVRHGIAEEGNGIDDAARKLTKEGIEQLRTSAKVMATLKIKPAHIYTSPRVRARQTAEIIGEALGIPVEIREEVNFSFSLRAVESLVSGDDVMFVGHEPSFSDTVGELTGSQVVMKKGGLARVDVYSHMPLRGALVWLIAPRVFMALAE
jgi:phosphohistidine phosphatase